jgi:hypothetical protein
MRLFRRKPSKEHLVVVHDLTGQDSEPFFVAICSCGWAGPKYATREEAFGDAYAHDPNVSQELEIMPEEGYGFLCCFCGESGTDPDEVAISASWIESGRERNQIFLAHGSCFRERLSDLARSGPIGGA